MPYLVGSIMALVAAMIILLTRFDPDDSQITAEVERAKSMFLAVDSYVNTYIQSGGDLTQINFATLYKFGILSGNISKDYIFGVTLDDSKTYDEETNKDKFPTSQLKFPKSEIIWQIVPIVSGDTIPDGSESGKDISSSAGTGYKLFVDFSSNLSLKSKGAFSENFFGKEICEKTLFGTFISDSDGIDDENKLKTAGSNSDSKFACVVFK